MRCVPATSPAADAPTRARVQAYAQEIAPQMLVRQQAQAIVDARKTIVAAAVGIVSDALEGLKDRGLEVERAEQPKLIANLMTVICSEKSPVPTIDM